MKLIIKNLVGENCVTMDDGQKVYDAIFSKLSSGKKIELDFSGVEVFASPFLNSAIGQLLKNIPENKLTSLLVVKNMTASSFEVLKRVIENSKEYYSKANVKNAVDKVLQKQEGDLDD
jgi:hypothetical protein